MPVEYLCSTQGGLSGVRVFTVTGERLMSVKHGV